MVDGRLADTPTAHVYADLLADYPDVTGELTRAPTAHVAGKITTTEPGP